MAIASRLQLIAAKLHELLSNAQPGQKQRASASLCDLLLRTLDLDHPYVHAAMDTLRSGAEATTAQLEQMKALVEKLDDVYFDLHESFEEGNVERAQYLAAFCKARAANAILCLLQAEISEAAYEANAATEDLNGVTKVIESALIG